MQKDRLVKSIHKNTLDSEDRRTKENQRIACGRKFFGVLDVYYGVVTTFSEVSM